MEFDHHNKVIHLCTKGMQKEGEMKPAEAKAFFIKAWQEAASDIEKFIAAHYMARHQETIKDKLKWDELALRIALKIDTEQMKSFYPSLNLNIGKCHEDLGNMEQAMACYNAAKSYIPYLPDSGYGEMIKSGIDAGLSRIASVTQTKSKSS